MMMMTSGRNNNIRFPFTASQWQELEHQALVFKYMVSGIPVPPDLLFTIRRSFDSSLSSNFLIHQPQHIGWNSFQMGFGRKIDPEPGRCRRTDGKKWRCSKDAYSDSKYCERHMHRGRNRSRKPVENILSISNKNTHLPLPPFLSPPATSEPHLLSPHYSASSTPLGGIGPVPSQEHASLNFLEHIAHSRDETTKDYGPIIARRNGMYGHGTKREISVGEHATFITEANSNDPRTTMMMRNIPRDNDSSSSSSSSKLMTMGPSLSQMRHSINLAAYSSDLLLKHADHYCACDHVPLNSSERDEDHQRKKVMHRFLDEWQPTKEDDSWPSSEDHTTQLSISIPNSLHDFFMTRKW